MPGSVTGMNTADLPQPPLPPVAPAIHPGTMPGGVPLPQGMPQQSQPGPAASPRFIVQQQPNGTGLLRSTMPDGSIGPVLKIIKLPKQQGAGPQPGMPAGAPPAPAVSMQPPQ